ncbi:hypothetical protein [Spirosoma endbachense]|uniref:DUF4136 domain-containing protein n=1 Tax=Spirosoma endbachense TaxID=2666025 RepID=A0A6P1VPU7_9BACT|nr:hypothetical protein [Spirosoma endbachense]QHV94448.1 hypothetical protein GJR95_05180 [Spirosoma endbachense]
MKTLLTLLLLAVGFSAVAQRSSFSKEVTTDGQQLRIRVDAEQSGRSLHFNRSFDVSELDARAVKALENHILDSLDQEFDGRYAGVFNERKRDVKYKKKQNDESTVSMVIVNTNEDTNRDEKIVATSKHELSSSDVAPASVIHREDKENGRLWMQYTFKKDGDELVFERTANVLGKSESEKKAIIQETERSLGIKSMNQ